jgi:hypothetical protein
MIICWNMACFRTAHDGTPGAPRMRLLKQQKKYDKNHTDARLGRLGRSPYPRLPWRAVASSVPAAQRNECVLLMAAKKKKAKAKIAEKEEKKQALKA